MQLNGSQKNLNDKEVNNRSQGSEMLTTDQIDFFKPQF